ncbi:MAG: hypothetical protein J6R59_01815 [Paludibacteraceae bacterium]|nr:hypothetical protein [Paludibacteraceae bacterium]
MTSIYNVYYETLELFERVRHEMSRGYRFFVKVNIDNKIKSGEIINSHNWSSSHVVIKFDDGSILRVPMNNVTNVEC